jgi:ribosomal protein S18 acetylase RimI-like enzyme
LPRIAENPDAPLVARLLDAFNREFDEETPGAEALTGNARELMEGDDAVFLLEDGEGVALVRFRQSVWTGKPEAYLQELYVVPEARGRGLGRGLLEACMAVARERGATGMDISVDGGDAPAIALYESAGFTNRNKDGTYIYFFERDL